MHCLLGKCLTIHVALLNVCTLCCAVLPQGQMLTLLLDIASGMSYLHSRNVLHVSAYTAPTAALMQWFVVGR